MGGARGWWRGRGGGALGGKEDAPLWGELEKRWPAVTRLFLTNRTRNATLSCESSLVRSYDGDWKAGMSQGPRSCARGVLGEEVEGGGRKGRGRETKRRGGRGLILNEIFILFYNVTPRNTSHRIALIPTLNLPHSPPPTPNLPTITTQPTLKLTPTRLINHFPHQQNPKIDSESPPSILFQTWAKHLHV